MLNADTAPVAAFATTPHGVRPEPAPEDARHHLRVPLEVEVNVASDHNFFMGFSENISEGGLFIATHGLQEMGSVVGVELHLPGPDGEIRTILAQGVVRWVRIYNELSDAPPGMGLQFVALSDEDARAIRQFVDTRTPIFFD